ncbi:hypothetical protein [Microbacterium sp. nov. GSS16]|uniref:hypothetical protein n=1 Tax=Microbacterium sp. nov. GSS16 TaxID=3019890 RepID=UPI0023063578|nr:hypothetical protein [Microbacterium sp. nov. GSS16]WCD92912.1 hypothetical protein PGB26_01135 [Microbacterium sp. nov. GSS16]
MNIADMMGALRRRWYVLVVGVLVAAAAAYGVWTVVKVDFTRTATQLMLPGPATIPEDANPFLYVGGLSQAADVLTRKMGAPDVLADVNDAHPDVEITVTRDPLSSGPVLLITAVSQSDAAAGQAVEELVRLTDTTLRDIQSTERIPDAERITLVTLTQDSEGVVGTKNRMVAAGGAGLGVGVLTLLLVALIDGLARSRSRRRGRKRRVPPGIVLPDDGDGQAQEANRAIDDEDIIDAAVGTDVQEDASGPREDPKTRRVPEPAARMP